MKKFIAIFLMLALLMPVCFATVSCSTADKLNRLGEYERAFELYSVAEKQTAIDERDSYTLGMDFDINIDLGNSITVDGTGKASAVYYSEGGKNISYTESIEMSIATKSGKSEQIVMKKMSEGYMDGKLFIDSEPEKDGVTIWSELSEEDYIEFRKSASEYSVSRIPEISNKICKSATAKQNDDGSWTAKFWAFDKESLRKMDIFLFGTESLFAGKYDFCDIEITINTDKDFILRSMEIKPIFVENESKPENDEAKMPEILIKQEVKDIGSTQKPASVEFKDENKVQDLRLAYEFERKLSEFKNANEADFAVEISQVARYNSGSQSTKEKDTVSFSGKNGDFKYDITSSTDSNDITMNYENGSKHIVIKTKNGTTKSNYTTESNDSVEVAFVNSVLGLASFSHTSITDIGDMKYENDIIKLIIGNPDISNLNLPKVKSASAEIRPYYSENGDFEGYKYTLNIEYYHGSLGKVTLKIVYNVNIESFSTSK